MNGTWSIMNHHVLVKYDGIYEKLKYFDQLSLESLGEESALPGFVGSFDENKGVLGGHPLLTPALRPNSLLISNGNHNIIKHEQLFTH